MVSASLNEFISSHRDELLRRCRDKVVVRPYPPWSLEEVERGIPLFMDQLVEELGRGRSQNEDIAKSATRHGQDLLRHGFTIGQVVHDYGAVCQSVTDLAVELSAPISTDDFRTLNRCLDDAIAGAVTEFTRGEVVTRDAKANQLRNLTNTAITAFEVLQIGSVGVGGTTGSLVHGNLMKIRALL